MSGLDQPDASYAARVDALVGLLDGVRARGAFVLRLSLDPPWSMRIQDEAPLTLICQTHGPAVIVAPMAKPGLGPGSGVFAGGVRPQIHRAGR
jgi:hypothetical protein